MGLTKFKMERFNGQGDFDIWRKWIKIIFVQQKVPVALSPLLNFPKGTSDADESQVLKTAYSTIILYLSDNLLRQVVSEIIAL